MARIDHGARGPRRFSCRLAGAPDEAAQLRARCRELLAEAPPEAVYDAVLILTELVTNVHMHTPDRRGLVECRVDRGRIRIAVTDAWPVVPTLRRDAKVGGHGLPIIDALADRWAVVLHPDGKTVWAEVLVPSDGAAPSRADRNALQGADGGQG